jgi:hypothetical protein
MTVPKWHEARVHPDQFIQFEKKAYGLPEEYRGRDVWVRKCGNYVGIHYNSRLVRTYRIPTTTYRAYDPNDFPEQTRNMMEGDFPKHLISQAAEISVTAMEYIADILKPHAYLNMRRAMSVLSAIREFRNHPRRDEVLAASMRERIRKGGDLKKVFEADNAQARLFGDQPCLERSTEGDEMVRPADYYIN